MQAGGARCSRGCSTAKGLTSSSSPFTRQGAGARKNASKLPAQNDVAVELKVQRLV